MGPRITPWADEKEWLYVKRCFYPGAGAPEAEDPRILAINRVKAWSVRGRVPHAVLSTQMLTSVHLKDQSQVLSSLEARLLLSMTLTRFVNGLLDPAQQAAFAISINALAKTIGLPESFVEIRHSATHDTLPSLPVLQSATIAALDWLWHHYWNVPDKELENAQDEGQALSELAIQIDAQLKSWKKLRKADPARPLKTGDADASTKQSIALLKELSKLKESDRLVSILTQKLMSPKNMLSSNIKTTEIWMPFLETLLKTLPRLRLEMILYGVRILGSDVKDELPPSSAFLAAEQISETRPGKDIPNIDGSYRRLFNWLTKLIWLEPRVEEDLVVITRSLGLEGDDFTMELLRKMDEEGIYDTKRAIELRLNGVIRSSHQDATEGSKRKADEPVDQILGSTKSGRWRRIVPCEDRYIGYLIQA